MRYGSSDSKHDQGLTLNYCPTGFTLIRYQEQGYFIKTIFLGINFLNALSFSHNMLSSCPACSSDCKTLTRRRRRYGQERQKYRTGTRATRRYPTAGGRRRASRAYSTVWRRRTLTSNLARGSCDDGSDHQQCSDLFDAPKGKEYFKYYRYI